MESVSFAKDRGFAALDFGFAEFSLNDKKQSSLSKAERGHLGQVRQKADQSDLEIACLRLNSPYLAGDEKSEKLFQHMVKKLALVAAELGCKRILFSLQCENREGWLESVESGLITLAEALGESGIRLLLSTATPSMLRGKSLRLWRPAYPQEWRELLAAVPNLSLSFSAADCLWQGIDYLKILPGLVQAIDHVEALDVEVNRLLLGDSGIFGPIWWNYRSPGKGQVDWRQLIEALKLYGYEGSLSITTDIDDLSLGDNERLMDNLETSVKTLAPLVK